MKQVCQNSLTERNIYGSSRLGSNNTEVELIGALPQSDNYSHLLGKKYFEAVNHLGNVVSVISDKKLAVENPNNPGTIGYYTADVVSATDYYPFGAPIQERSFSSGAYRYGFNGMEKDDEITGVTGSHLAFEYRIYDSRLGRWLSVDPHASSYPWVSPYSYCANNPIMFIDPDGQDVRVSLFVRIFRPKLYDAIKLYFEVHENRDRYMQFMTAKQQEKYLGIDKGTDGEYASTSDIKFTSRFSLRSGDYGLTSGPAKHSEPGIKVDGKWVGPSSPAYNGGTVDNNTPLKMRIEVNVFNFGKESFETSVGGLLETITHEDKLHAEPIMNFMKAIWDGALNSTTYSDFYKEQDPTNGLSRHIELGEGTNESFNTGVDAVNKMLDAKGDSAKGIKDDFNKSVQSDIKMHE